MLSDDEQAISFLDHTIWNVKQKTVPGIPIQWDAIVTIRIWLRVEEQLRRDASCKVCLLRASLNLYSSL